MWRTVGIRFTAASSASEPEPDLRSAHGRRISDTSNGDRPHVPNSRSFRLAVVSETFLPEVNGVALTLATLLEKLSAKNFEITVFRPWRDELPVGSTIPNVSEVRLPAFPIPGYPQLRMGWPASQQLCDAFSACRPDLVHVVTEGPLGASAITAARHLQIPVTSSFHTNFHQYLHSYGLGIFWKLGLSLLRHLHNATQRTFVPTEEVLNQLSASGFKNLSILSRGIDQKLFHPRRRCELLRSTWDALPDTPVIIHASRLAPEKDYPLLLKVIERIRSVREDAIVIFLGEGPLRESIERSHPFIKFPGNVSRHDIGRWLASADIYIHASRSETFGNVVPEALSSGLAFAGFDYAAARQLITPNRHGFLAPLNSPERLLLDAQRLVEEPETRNSLRRNAPQATAMLDWDSIATRFANELRCIGAPSLDPETNEATTHRLFVAPKTLLPAEREQEIVNPA
jgi:glycosyltransferase involved in cell wall biosynthesis